MASTAAPSPESISDGEFQGLLESYPACLAAISDAKGGMYVQDRPRRLAGLFACMHMTWRQRL
jgi:hypothetical protein